MEVNGTLCARCLLVSSLASPTGARRKGILRSAAATSGNTDMKGRTSERKRKPPAIVTVVQRFLWRQSVSGLSVAACRPLDFFVLRRSPPREKNAFSIDRHSPPPATGRARSSWPRMAAQLRARRCRTTTMSSGVNKPPNATAPNGSAPKRLRWAGGKQKKRGSAATKEESNP